MAGLPPLRSLEAFRVVMREGTFSAAAKILGLSPAAVSHRIRELERVLGTKLFERVGRNAVATEQARHYFEALTEGFLAIEAATRILNQPKGMEVLSIHSAPSFAAKWLMPRLKEFIRANPDIIVRLHSTTNDFQFNDNVYDVDIQYGLPVPSGCDSLQLAEEEMVPLAAPELFGVQPLDPKSVNFEKVVFLHTVSHLVQWTNWTEAFVGCPVSSEKNMHFDRSYLTVDAAVDGLGLCLESTLFAEREIRSGKLVMPFGGKSIKVRFHRLVWRKRSDQPRKILRFRDWLDSECVAPSNS